MVVVTNFKHVSYLVKDGKYNFEKVVVLLNEEIDLNNKANNIKDLKMYIKICICSRKWHLVLRVQ